MTPIEFLKAFHPDGPWVITAINPSQEGERTDTQTFLPSEEAQAKAFVDGLNGKWNLYFTPNRIGRKMRKKPERTDIEWLDYLHVDIDPRKWTKDDGDKAEYLKQEQARIKELLTSKLPEGTPKPTCVVFSGGGYQAFWKLAEPLKLDGSVDMAEDVKHWNIQLERAFGADTCHNIDRIMRLPGTVNIPTKKKMENEGRSQADANVVWFEPELVYDLEKTFIKAHQLQSSPSSFAGGGGRTRVKVEINSGNIQPLTDVHELDKYTADGKPLENRVKNIIQEGFDPDDHGPNAKPRGDRSVWVFDACCAMVRRGIPTEIMMAVLLDKDFRISDHIYDQKQGAEKYAKRQIERALEFAIDPALEELNRQYAVTIIGGKTRVLWEDFEELYKGEAHQVVKYMAPEDFRALYCNRFIPVIDAQGNPKNIPLGKWWFEHPDRRQFLGGVHFTPERSFPDKYNLWRGFAVPAKVGRNHESFLQHIRENICSDNEEWYTYFINWLAHMVQKPAEIAGVAIVIRGDPGTGKSFIPTHLARLLGPHFVHISSTKHLVGNFNAHMQDKLLVFGDEAIFHGDKQSQSSLKTLITEHTRMLERKGVDAAAMPNYTRLILASNDEQVIHAQGYERRYFVLTVSPKHRQDKEYFKKIAADLNDGGYENLLAFLSTVDISDFDPRDYPMTEELQRQKIMSLPPHIEWWLNCLQDGKVHPRHDGWMAHCPKEDAFASYTSYMHSLRINHQLNKTSLLKHLREVLPGLTAGQRDVEVIVPMDLERPEWEPVKQKKRLHCYLLPALKECRALFEARHGKQDWGEEQSA